MGVRVRVRDSAEGWGAFSRVCIREPIDKLSRRLRCMDGRLFKAVKARVEDLMDGSRVLPSCGWWSESW